MSTDLPTLFPGPIRQNGYIVRDLDVAIAEWLALGIGPWITLGPMTQQMVHRGEPTEVTLTLAFANSGDLQIELIHHEGDGPSAYQEFLDTGREGFHHLAWWAEDFDASEAAARDAGMELVLQGDGGGTARFFYVDAPTSAATCLEVMELNEMTEGLMAHIRTAADEWDGVTDPIRNLF